MHVRRVKDDTVDFAVSVRQVATVDAGFQVGSSQVVCAAGYISPEYAFAVSDVGNYAAGLNVQFEDLGENEFVAVQVGAEDEVVRGDAVTDNALGGRGRIGRVLFDWLIE